MGFTLGDEGAVEVLLLRVRFDEIVDSKQCRLQVGRGLRLQNSEYRVSTVATGHWDGDRRRDNSSFLDAMIRMKRTIKL